MEREAIDAFLLKAKTEGATFPEIARVLMGTEGLVQVWHPESAVAFLSGAVPPPPPVELTGQGGEVLACAFTHPDHARAFAETNALLGEEGVGITRLSGWPSGLRSILHGQYAGLILDLGTAHWLGFDPDQLRKLYAHARWDDLLGRRTLHVLRDAQGPFLVRDGLAAQASVAVEPAEAEAMVAAFARAGAVVSAVEQDFDAALEELLGLGITQAVMNDELPDWHVYGREELEWLRKARGGAQA